MKSKPSGIVLIFIFSFCFYGIVDSAKANEVIRAKVSFLGTQPEQFSDRHGYSARLRVRLKDSTCGKESTKKERWISIVSGRMEGKYAHNDANFKNTFSLLMTALLTDRHVQIDGASACSGKITLNLYHGLVGIY